MEDFVAARSRDDRPAMYDAWSGLVSNAWPRLQTSVYLSGRKILSAHERDDALSNAATRLTENVVWIFKGTSTDEFEACLASVARYACLDEQRKASKRSARGRSLDAPGLEGNDWAATVYADLESERQADADDAADEAELTLYGQRFLDWALPQLTPKRRAVMELLRVGKAREAIMEELEMARNTVDQNYKRAMQDLNELKERYAS